MSEAIEHGYKGITLLFVLNWDRILYVSAIGAALATAVVLNSAMI